jgi:hypothetical protein
MGPHEHEVSSSLEMPWQTWLIAWGRELGRTNQACRHERNKKHDEAPARFPVHTNVFKATKNQNQNKQTRSPNQTNSQQPKTCFLTVPITPRSLPLARCSCIFHQRRNLRASPAASTMARSKNNNVNEVGDRVNKTRTFHVTVKSNLLCLSLETTALNDAATGASELPRFFASVVTSFT